VQAYESDGRGVFPPLQQQSRIDFRQTHKPRFETDQTLGSKEKGRHLRATLIFGMNGTLILT